jgi:hypothetical protein
MQAIVTMLQSTFAARLDRLPLRQCRCRRQRQRKHGNVHHDQSLRRHDQVTAPGAIEFSRSLDFTVTRRAFRCALWSLRACSPPFALMSRAVCSEWNSGSLTTRRRCPAAGCHRDITGSLVHPLRTLQRFRRPPMPPKSNAARRLAEEGWS